MDNLSSPDLLSDLPLGVIHFILSLVPIEDAMRTCILSKQWRFIWSTLPRLGFDDTFVGTDNDMKSLFDYINQTLLLHKGPIHEFQLRLLSVFMSKKQGQYIDRWLLFLSKNDIRILNLEFDEYSYLVHSSMYSCQYLTHLKLHICTIPPPPPSFKGFLFLKSLDIYLPEVDSATIESIVAHSPLLEDLTLESLGCLKMKICAPNLKYLDFVYAFDDLLLCTPLLQVLKGDFYHITSFSIGVEYVVFHHLRTIELYSVAFDDGEVAPSVIRLIMGSPNLQKLQISGKRSFEDDPPELACFWHTEPVPNLTYNSLKVIKIERCGGCVDETKLIELLLARSPVLEKMIYEPFPWISDRKMCEISRYHRASANAQILFRKRDRFEDEPPMS